MARGDIKPIENEETRQVCFTKRRESLFNKASELSILCGAMVGSVAFSTIGTSFSFGHPSIDDVANRFINSVPSDAPASSGASNANNWPVVDTIHGLNVQYSEMQQSLKSEKKKNEMLQAETKNKMGGRLMQLLNKHISKLDLDELQELQKYVEAIHGVVEEDNKMPETSQTQALVPQQPTQMPPDLQYQFDEHITADPIAFTGPSSSNAFFDDGVFDDPMFSGDLHDVFSLGNSPNN